MKFLIKVFSVLLILATVYLLLIFVYPSFADKLSEYAWFPWLNSKIRTLKSTSDNFSEDVLNKGKATDLIETTKKTVDDAANWIKKTKDIINEKVEQTNKVIESWEKVIDSANEFQKNISDLTTVSWSSN